MDDVITVAKSLVVRNNLDADSANSLIKDVKRLQKAIDESYKPLIAKAKEAVKAIEDEYKAKRKPFDEAEAILKQKIGEYYDELRKQEELERRLKEEAERARLEADKQAMVETLLKNGFEAEAKELLQQQVVPVVEVESKRLEGISERVIWRAEVVDMKAFLKAVIDGIVPIEAVKVNEAYLNSAARAFHEMLNIPGVRAVKEKSIAVRA